MRTGSHEYANETNDDDILKPAQSLRTPVPRQKLSNCKSVPLWHKVKIVYSSKHMLCEGVVMRKGREEEAS